VFLGLRENPAFRFTRTAMHDDGTNGDSITGDGRYTLRLKAGAGNVEYYVYAENNDAGVFSPPRAEHEFLTLPVAGSVVINELMTDNVRTARDPSGQYDDWIEFYNNSSSAFDLDGCLLSDDSTKLTKWVFPDTSLAAGQYLIVWADADTEQAGLHANFVLPKSGVAVVFSDADGHPIDRVVLGPQSSDISFGRYPNGTGSYRRMNPTFGVSNDSGVGVAESPEPFVARLSARAFPNPFMRSTAISYTMPQSGKVTVRVFDAAGRLAATLFNGEQAAGRHAVSFSLPSGARPCGVYFARLAVAAADGAGSFESVKLVRAR
jgi:hypothetical protein